MKFSDFISSEAIKADLHADSKEDVIREMTAALLEAGKIPPEEQESIVKAIMKREELGSTGIGRGVAVPHTVATPGSTPVTEMARNRAAATWRAGSPRRVSSSGLLPS